MSQNFDCIVQGGSICTPWGIYQADIGIQKGRIEAIGNLASSHGAQIIDAKGLHVLPGVIDSQVHFREPGFEHKEDLESGMRSAILGGVTCIFEMPNTSPPTTSRISLEDKLSRAQGRAWCDYAFFMGACLENIHQLAELELLEGVCGIKLFMGSSTGSLLVDQQDAIERILSTGHRPVAVHSEDETRLQQRFEMIKDGAHPREHTNWRDEITALTSTSRLIDLARKAKRHVHVLHVTTAEEMEFLSKNKDVASVEVTPQHLTLIAPQAYDRLGTLAQMNPPIRSEKHVNALWHAVQTGVVDILGSDHAPHLLEEKDRPYPTSPSGMTGVQTLVPVLLDHVAQGRLSLERFVDLTAHGPARIFGLKCKGRIARGYDADLTFVDLKRKETIERSWIASKSGWSPFEGMEVTGWPVQTMIRGNIVMCDGQVLDQPIGQMAHFL